MLIKTATGTGQKGVDTGVEVLAFGAQAQQRAQVQGVKVETFDFLGFTHYGSRSRNGKRFRMKRKTIGKRFTAKLKVYKEWLKANRTRPTPEILRKTAAKLRGHYAYYGVTDNSKRVQAFAYETQRILFIPRRSHPSRVRRKNPADKARLIAPLVQWVRTMGFRLCEVDDLGHCADGLIRSPVTQMV